MRDTSQLSVVFVGCGGTFFMGMPYFRVLVRQYKPWWVHFVDPDRMKGKNRVRQWPSLGRGTSKCHAARQEFDPPVSSDQWGLSFKEFIQKIGETGLLETDLTQSHPRDKDVLLVVSVDNDAARLEVREWARNRKGWTGMVVSGCEADYGQAYWGAWENGVAIHDWRTLHMDVGRDEGTEHRCALQTAEANALTGVLAGLALKDLLLIYRTYRSREGEKGLPPSLEKCPLMVREYYWERTHPPLSLVKSWTLEVTRMAEVVPTR